MCGVNSETLKSAGLGAQAFGAVSSVFGTYRKSKAEQAGYEAQAQVARNNAQIAEWQALDVERRGVDAQQRLAIHIGKTIGAQDAVLASRNVAINEGSALNIRADTAFLAKRDQNILSDNTAKEAWAFRNQATFARSNADILDWRAESQSPLLDAGGTLLSGAGRVAQAWYALNKASPGVAKSADPYDTIGQF